MTICDRKVWVEYDGMEPGITQDLIEGEIPEERIVLAFLPERQVVTTV
ncbi:MAG: element excision factor XisI family protein [Heteroscytonema crispum UTEX LB 1556]